MTILKPPHNSNDNDKNPIAKGWKNLWKKPALPKPSPWSFVPISFMASATTVFLVAILATAHRSPISRIEIHFGTDGGSMTVEGSVEQPQERSFQNDENPIE